MNEIPKDWRGKFIIGSKPITLGGADIEAIRTAAIQYFSASNHPERETFIVELQKLPAFIGETGAPKIGFWMIENRQGKLALTRYPPPSRFMTFHSLELSVDDRGWQGVATRADEYISRDRRPSRKR